MAWSRPRSPTIHHWVVRRMLGMDDVVWYVPLSTHDRKETQLRPFRLDTIYACQDKRDDVKAGVKSTAILFGAYIKPILSVFASALVASLWYAGVANNMGLYYKAISVFGSALYLATEMVTVDLDEPKSCWATVRISPHFGGVV
jgi:hypothetical protein